MYWGWEEVWGILIVCAFVVLLGVGIYFGVKADNEWHDWAAKHCKVTRKISGHSSSGYGMSYDGKFGYVSTYTPGKTCWLCDDGVEYCR